MTKQNQNPISANLLSEIKNALESVAFGSIEIFVQNKVVTQITVRNIHKTSVEIQTEEQSIQSKNNSVYIRKSSVRVR